MLCNKSFIAGEFTKSHIVDAGGDVHDSFSHPLPSVTGTEMI